MNGFLWTCLLEVTESLPALKLPKLITLYNRQYTSYGCSGNLSVNQVTHMFLSLFNGHLPTGFIKTAIVPIIKNTEIPVIKTTADRLPGSLSHLKKY